MEALWDLQEPRRRGKRSEGEIVGDRGVVTEEEGILFVQNLDGRQMHRLLRTAIVACVLVVVAVVLFLGVSLLASFN